MTEEATDLPTLCKRVRDPAKPRFRGGPGRWGGRSHVQALVLRQVRDGVVRAAAELLARGGLEFKDSHAARHLDAYQREAEGARKLTA